MVDKLYTPLEKGKMKSDGNNLLSLEKLFCILVEIF